MAALNPTEKRPVVFLPLSVTVMADYWLFVPTSQSINSILNLEYGQSVLNSSRLSRLTLKLVKRMQEASITLPLWVRIAKISR